MSWWVTIVSGMVGGRGFLPRLVDAWDNRDRRRLIQHGYDTTGIDGARALAEAIAIAEVHIRTTGPPPPASVDAESDPPKALEPVPTRSPQQPEEEIN